ncbi:MAG: N-acetyltransferase [Bacteroidales bacterium]|nr:N-acetyltransferase [Bacteroidales bacterium]
MTPRLATSSDITDIMTVMEAARGIMRSDGNLGQWVNGYPSEEIIRQDIDASFGHVLEENGRIVGYFAFVSSPEPTYAEIFGGQWLDDTAPYHVIHRIGSFPEVHGVFSAIMGFAFSRDRNIRIDTHRDNRIMQHNILKHRFSYCGIIYLESGDERLAYQRILR